MIRLFCSSTNTRTESNFMNSKIATNDVSTTKLILTNVKSKHKEISDYEISDAF